MQMVLCVLTGWLDRRERDAVAYLIEENRLLHPTPEDKYWDDPIHREHLQIS